ncbi:MAG: GspH/FimT family pseudopilin [Janthinobacterium lividum]
MPGFSAVEALTVLAITGITMTLGAPAFGSLVNALRLTSTVNEFFTAVSLARSEALRRGSRVDLVPAGDGSNWNQGWVVLIDRNRNHQLDAGDTVIQHFAAAPRGLSITPHFNMADHYLAFNAAGRTRTDASSQQPAAQPRTLAVRIEWPAPQAGPEFYQQATHLQSRQSAGDVLIRTGMRWRWYPCGSSSIFWPPWKSSTISKACNWRSTGPARVCT